jgi:predicted O-methyltransferase YrrM
MTEVPKFREPEWIRVMDAALRFRRDPFIAGLEQAKARHAVEGSTGVLDAAIIYGLISVTRPRIVIESGTHVGMSAACILKAFADADIDGVLYSVEIRPSEKTAILVPSELRDRLQIVLGDIRELADTDALPAIADMFFHDSNHSLPHQLWEFTTFWPRIRAGGLLASHDVDLSAGFAHFVEITYAHDPLGRTDFKQTSHVNWGRIGRIGFILKA